MARKPGLFCLEGPWEGRLTSSPDSVRPVLEFFSSTAASPYPLVYRRVFGRTDFTGYIQQWKHSKYREFETLYLASHGLAGGLIIGADTLKLLEIAELLRSFCAGKVVMFGACCTLSIPGERVRQFLS